METLVNIAQLIQNNFWVRGLYVIFCCVIIFFIVSKLDKYTRQKKGFSDNESIIP